MYKSLPLVDLDLFYGKLSFGYIGFSMDKSENRILACDLKVGRYRHIKGQGHFLTLAKGYYKSNVKLNFFSNHLTKQRQILYGVSLGWRNKSLYKWSRSHDQDGHHGYK